MSESGTKPSDEMAWASAAAAGDIVTPPAAQEAAGYTFNQVLPHDEFNYILKNFTDWISYLHEGRPRIFSDFYSLCTTLAEGETGIVADNTVRYSQDNESPGRDSTLAPAGVEQWTGDSNPTGVNPDTSHSSPICTDGKYVYAASASSIDSFGDVSDYANKYLIAIDISTWTVAWSVGNLTGHDPEENLDHVAVACDGKYVFLSQNSQVFKIDPADGSQVGGWSFDHYSGGTSAQGHIHSIFADGFSVFVGGAAGTDDKTHRRLSYSDGSIIASGDHEASVHSIVADGDFVYIGGAESDDSYNCIVRKLDYGTLFAIQRDFDLNNGSTGEDVVFGYGGTGSPRVRDMVVTNHCLYIGGRDEEGYPLVARLELDNTGQFEAIWDSSDDGLYTELHNSTVPHFGDVISLALTPAGYLWVGVMGGTAEGTIPTDAFRQRFIHVFSASEGGPVKAIDVLASSGVDVTDNTELYRCYSCTDGFRMYSFFGKGGVATGTGDGSEIQARVQMRFLPTPPTLATRISSGRFRPFMGLAVPHFNEDR